jgi:DNA-binding CsgD family transcriptional regulator
MSDVPRLGVDAPLVGRTEEYGRLTAALDAARDAHPAAVLLAGDAGVGKTRLLTELRRQARQQGFTVLIGHCVDLGMAGLPYLPFTEALGQLDPTTPGLSRPALAPLLPGPAADAPGLPTADFGQLQLFDAVAALLAELAAAAPVLLVIEDLHWADQSTRDLLSFLLARLRMERLAIIASYRADDLHRRHPLRPLLGELVRLPAVERVDVAPFSPAETRDYLRALHPTPLPGRVVRRIVERSEGNAFFVEELLDASLETGDEALPTGLAEVLLTRLEQVAAPVQTVVRAAAVAGRRVDHRLLQEVVQLSPAETEEALREAVTRHVLVAESSGTYAFRHALLQEAVYADLLPGERVRLHGAYAAALADGAGAGQPGSAGAFGRSPAAELAYHCYESHDLPGALAASVRAATEASALHAPSEALRHLEQALTLWHAVPDAAAVAGVDLVHLGLRAANAASASGRMERAVALTQDAAAHADAETEPLLAGMVQQRLAQHLLGVDREEEALRAAARARDLVPTTAPPTPERTWIAAISARTSVVVSDYEASRRYGDEAVTAARTLGLPDAEADALATLAVLAEKEGNPDEAALRLADAREWAITAGDIPVELRASYNLAANRFYQGDLSTASDMLDRAAARAAETGLSWSAYGLELRVLQVITRYMTGDWDGSLAAASGTDEVSDWVAGRLAAAALYVDTGRGEPRRTDRERRCMHDCMHDPQIVALTGGCEADARQWAGQPEGSAAIVTDAIERAGRVWGQYTLGGIWLAAIGVAGEADRAATARLVGDPATVADAVAAGRELAEFARTAAERGKPRAGRMGPEGTAWLARLEAEWSRLDGTNDPALWAAAVEAFDFGYVYEIARSNWRLAEALVQADRRDEAAGPAKIAYETAVRLRAAPLRGAVEALVRRARIDAGLPIRLTTDLLLTPRERDVLALLARGRTNRQIGRELFISEKTASVHVSNIIGKLGASGRTEAVAIAHRRGLIEAQPETAEHA